MSQKADVSVKELSWVAFSLVSVSKEAEEIVEVVMFELARLKSANAEVTAVDFSDKIGLGTNNFRSYSRCAERMLFRLEQPY